MKVKRSYIFILICIFFFVVPLKVGAVGKWCKYYKVADQNTWIFYSEQTTGAILAALNKLFQAEYVVLYANDNGSIVLSYKGSFDVTPEKITSIDNCPKHLCVPNKGFQYTLPTSCYNTGFEKFDMFSYSQSGFGSSEELFNPDNVFSAANGSIKFESSLLAIDCTSNPNALVENVPVFGLFKIAYLILKIAAPVAMILFGMLDFAKAMTSSDDGKMKKAQSSFLKRLIAAIIVFLAFSIFELAIGLIPNSGSIMECLKAIF